VDRSLHEDYPYPSNAKERALREDLQAPEGRVVRGGMFDINPANMRCARRIGFSPGYRPARRSGFRVVVRPAS